MHERRLHGEIEDAPIRPEDSISTVGTALTIRAPSIVSGTTIMSDLLQSLLEAQAKASADTLECILTKFALRQFQLRYYQL